MEVLTRLSRFAERQESINADLLAGQEQFRSYMAQQGSDSDSDSSIAAEEEKFASSQVEDNEEKKRQVVRNSRKSVTLLNDNNGTLYTGDMLSPTGPPPARKQTEAEKERRQSRLFHTPASKSLHIKTPASAVKPKSSVLLPAVDKSRHSKYYEANLAMGKIDKFYGDRKNDKDIDVYTFVRSVDFQLDRWMEDEPFGRLELVTSCTGGAAQMWLLNKRRDLNTMLGLGRITAEMAEWEYVRDDFIDNMGGGQVKRLHQTKLDGLKLGRGGDSEELAKFITKFHEYSQRAYPLDDYPDTPTRSSMLGRLFETRVRDSDWGLWSQMMRMTPNTDKLEDLEQALQVVWNVEQHIRSQKSKKLGEYAQQGGVKANKGGGYANNSHPSQYVHHLEVAGETSDDNRQEGETSSETLNAAAATKSTNGGSGQKRKNKHIDGAVAKKLIELKRCLHCYKKNDHWARECTAPANRPPTDAELKA